MKDTLIILWQGDPGSLGFVFFKVQWHLGVSKNNGTPKSSILIGISLINHPFWDTPIFGNTLFFLLRGAFAGANSWKAKTKELATMTKAGSWHRAYPEGFRWYRVSTIYELEFLTWGRSPYKWPKINGKLGWNNPLIGVITVLMAGKGPFF